MSQLAEKWRSVEYVKDREATDLLMHRAVHGGQQTGFSDPVAGNVIIHEDDERGVICEVVGGTRAEDAIGTLYKPNAIFNSPGTLREARLDLITMIEDIHEAPNGMNYLQGKCKARGRDADLSELPTIQLIDILANLVRKRAH